MNTEDVRAAIEKHIPDAYVSLGVDDNGKLIELSIDGVLSVDQISWLADLIKHGPVT